MKSPNDSPAINTQSPIYPTEWEGGVPRAIRATATIKSQIPGNRQQVLADQEYPVWVDENGSVFAILDNGDMLCLKVDEFVIVDWHN